MVLKVNSDKSFTRVAADICDKIGPINWEFIQEIVKRCKNSLTHLLNSKQSILGLLEFITLMNKKAECKSLKELTKFVIFEIIEKEWINGYVKYCKEYCILLEFINLNIDVILNMPDHAAGDIFYRMRLQEYSEDFDPEYDCIIESEKANPSVKYVINYMYESETTDFNEILNNNPQDLHIFEPVKLAEFFVANACEPEFYSQDHREQKYLSKFIKFIVDTQNNEKSKKLLKTIANTLKSNFITQNIIEYEEMIEKFPPEFIKASSAFITELYNEKLITEEDFKVFSILIVSKLSSTDDLTTPICDSSTIWKNYMIKFTESIVDEDETNMIQLRSITNEKNGKEFLDKMARDREAFKKRLALKAKRKEFEKIERKVDEKSEKEQNR